MQTGAWSTGIGVNCNGGDAPFLCIPIASLHARMSHMSTGLPGTTRGHSTREQFPYVGLVIVTDRNAAPGHFTAQDEATVECLSAVLGNIMSRYPAATLIDHPYVPPAHLNVGPELPNDWQLPDFIASSLARIGHGQRRRVLRTATAATFPRRNITQSTFEVPGLGELSCVARHIESVAEQLDAMRMRLMQLETNEQASQRRQQALSRDLVEAQQVAARQTEVAEQHDHAARLLREELVAKTVGGPTRRGTAMGGPGDPLHASPSRRGGPGGGGDGDAAGGGGLFVDDWVPNVSMQMDAKASAELKRIRQKVTDLDALSKSRSDKWRNAHPDAAAEFDLQRMSGHIAPDATRASASPRGGSGKLALTKNQEALSRHPPPKPPTYVGLPGQSRPPPRGSSASARAPASIARDGVETESARRTARELRNAITKAKEASAARQRLRARIERVASGGSE
jgi:hypothetical protein